MAAIIDYFKPTVLRLLLFLVIAILANVPYIGTAVKGEGKCFEKQCSDPLSSCSAGKHCYMAYEARPSWVFWWTYPEFSMHYDRVEFSAQAIPLLEIRRRPEIYSQNALAATALYWYLVVLAITLPYGRERD